MVAIDPSFFSKKNKTPLIHHRSSLQQSNDNHASNTSKGNLAGLEGSTGVLGGVGRQSRGRGHDRGLAHARGGSGHPAGGVVSDRGDGVHARQSHGLGEDGRVGASGGGERSVGRGGRSSGVFSGGEGRQSGEEDAGQTHFGLFET